MKCLCGDESMDFVSCYDNPNTGYAFNVYACDCGFVMKEDVWNNKGKTWISVKGDVHTTDVKV